MVALYGLAALFSIGSLLIVRSTQNILLELIVLSAVTAWFFSTRVQYEEFLEFRAYLMRAFRSQRRVVANQILIRKASQELEKASHLIKSWEVLTSTLHTLGFDGARCLLAGWPKVSVASLPVWQRAGTDFPDHSWNISIPLHAGCLMIGVLQLRRSLEKDRMLFQFSSVLETLIPSFERRLSAEFNARAKSEEKKHSMHGGALPGCGLLRTVEEKHEAVTSEHEFARIGG